MSSILTFLGKGGTGRTTIAIAAAKRFARQGQKVLLVSQGIGPVLELLLGQSIGAQPQEVEAHLEAVQLHTAQLLGDSWEQIKDLEAQYLRTPFFKKVYGQELGVLPGMDEALGLHALREYDASGKYDLILYDGAGDQTTLRMLGMPESLGWYARRFRSVFTESELGKTLAPFFQPIAAAVLNVSWSGDTFNQPMGKMDDLLAEGKAAMADPSRVAAYLVTTPDPMAIASARYLWSGAQQVSLTVGGVILNRATSVDETLTTTFAPLPVSLVPPVETDWDTLMAALPDFPSQVKTAPRPISIDLAQGQVKLFLPGLDKTQVKLTQSGPEVTVEAGDQRRNIFLPPELSGKKVTGAKFQDGYLIVSF